MRNFTPKLLERRLMEFNQLPSTTLHRSRRAEFAKENFLAMLEANPRGRAALHKHWSGEILKTLGAAAEPVCDAEASELALALLPSENMERLMRTTGAVLCAPRLRRVIQGNELRAFSQALGKDVVDFARGSNILHPGLPESCEWSVEVAVQAINALGRRTLLNALSSAGDQVLRRVELKLPNDDLVDGATGIMGAPQLASTAPESRLPPSTLLGAGAVAAELPKPQLPEILSPEKALALEMSILAATEGEWVSSFSTPH